MEITHLYISREGEVLPEGMTFEPIVCKDAPQVWMIGEEHTKHVPNLNAQTQSIHLNNTELKHTNLKLAPQAQTHLPLIPVGSDVDWDCRVHRCQLIRVGLDTNTRVIA